MCTKFWRICTVNRDHARRQNHGWWGLRGIRSRVSVTVHAIKPLSFVLLQGNAWHQLLKKEREAYLGSQFWRFKDRLGKAILPISLHCWKAMWGWVSEPVVTPPPRNQREKDKDHVTPWRACLLWPKDLPLGSTSWKSTAPPNGSSWNLSQMDLLMWNHSISTQEFREGAEGEKCA
jgi:hypothetical protein